MRAAGIYPPAAQGRRIKAARVPPRRNQQRNGPADPLRAPSLRHPRRGPARRPLAPLGQRSPAEPEMAATAEAPGQAGGSGFRRRPALFPV